MVLNLSFLGSHASKNTYAGFLSPPFYLSGGFSISIINTHLDVNRLRSSFPEACKAWPTALPAAPLPLQKLMPFYILIPSAAWGFVNNLDTVLTEWTSY